MITGLTISWLLAGLSSSLIISCILLKQFDEIEGINIPPIILSIIVGWMSIIILGILGIISIIKDIKENGFNRYKFIIVNYLMKKERKRFEKWLLTPEGKKEKYKHLFKDA